MVGAGRGLELQQIWQIERQMSSPAFSKMSEEEKGPGDERVENLFISHYCEVF